MGSPCLKVSLSLEAFHVDVRVIRTYTWAGRKGRHRLTGLSARILDSTLCDRYSSGVLANGRLTKRSSRAKSGIGGDCGLALLRIHMNLLSLRLSLTVNWPPGTGSPGRS